MAPVHMLTPENTPFPVNSEHSLLINKLALTHISPPTMDVNPQKLLKVKKRMIGSLVGMLKSTSIFELSLVKAAIKHIWGKAILFDFFPISGNRFILKFKKEKDKEWVMSNNPWSILGALLLLKEIKEDDEASEMPLNELPLWVEFSDLKSEHFDWSIIREIGGQLGTVDPSTPKKGQITGDEELKILITMSIDAPLPSVTPAITVRGDYTLIKVKYLGIPQPFCIFCIEFGHTSDNCQVKQSVMNALDDHNAEEQHELNVAAPNTTVANQNQIGTGVQNHLPESSSSRRNLTSKFVDVDCNVACPFGGSPTQIPGLQVSSHGQNQEQPTVTPSSLEVPTVGSERGHGQRVYKSNDFTDLGMDLDNSLRRGSPSNPARSDMQCNQPIFARTGLQCNQPSTHLSSALFSTDEIVHGSAALPFWLNSPPPAINQPGLGIGLDSENQNPLGMDTTPGLTISGHGHSTPSLGNQFPSHLDQSPTHGNELILPPISHGHLDMSNAVAEDHISQSNNGLQAQIISSDHNVSQASSEDSDSGARTSRAADPQNSQFDPSENPSNHENQTQAHSCTNSVNQGARNAVSRRRRCNIRSIHHTETRRIQTRSSSSALGSGRSRTRPRRG